LKHVCDGFVTVATFAIKSIVIWDRTLRRFETVTTSTATVVTTVFRTVAKLSCNTQIINGLITVANVQLQRFQPLQTAILTVAKCSFSCSVANLFLIPANAQTHQMIFDSGMFCKKHPNNILGNDQFKNKKHKNVDSVRNKLLKLKLRDRKNEKFVFNSSRVCLH
jgi:hypothetical protein